MKYQVFNKKDLNKPIEAQIFTESEILEELKQLSEAHGKNFSSIEDFNNWSESDWLIQEVDNQ